MIIIAYDTSTMPRYIDKIQKNTNKISHYII
jgi:hypothetical protein